MNMIHLHIQFYDLAMLPLWKGPDTIFNLLTNFSCQYFKSIFGNPNDMVLTMPYRLW
jgi:hypothetical protein